MTLPFLITILNLSEIFEASHENYVTTVKQPTTSRDYTSKRISQNIQRENQIHAKILD